MNLGIAGYKGVLHIRNIEERVVHLVQEHHHERGVIGLYYTEVHPVDVRAPLHPIVRIPHIACKLL